MRRLAVSIALLAAAGAAQQRPTLTLTMGKAVEFALAPDGNTRLALAREAVAASEARRGIARGALLPNLDAAWSYQSFTRNLGAFGISIPPIPGFAFPILAGPLEVSDARATATFSIFDWASWKRYAAAKEAVAAALAERATAELAVTAAVARTYVAAVRADSALATARANVALAERLLALAQSQKQAGTGIAVEVTRAEVQLANERQRLLVAGEERTAAVLLLLRTAGIPLDYDVTLAGGLVHRPETAEPLTAALAAAREKRPEFAAQRHRRQGAQHGYEAARAERFASAAAFADYGNIGAAGGPHLPTRTVGVQVRVPLFDGGRRDARRAESLSALRAEEIRARDLDQQVEFEIRLAQEALASAAGQVNVAREGLTQAERELEQAQRRYEAGVASGIEVTDAQTRLARARENQVAALARHEASRIDYSLATGRVERVLE
jgi:outer membrane protein TolC